MNSRQYLLILASLRIDQQEIERLIMATPTGPVRNALCDAQIHILAAVRVLEGEV